MSFVGGLGEGRGGGRPIMDFSPWTLFRPPGDVKSATSPTIHFNSNSWQGCTSCVVQQGANITFQHILTSFCLSRISDQLICNEGGGWRYLPSDFFPKVIILPQGLGMDSHRLVRHTSNSLLHRGHLGVCQHRRGQKSFVILWRLMASSYWSNITGTH